MSSAWDVSASRRVTKMGDGLDGLLLLPLPSVDSTEGSMDVAFSMRPAVAIYLLLLNLFQIQTIQLIQLMKMKFIFNSFASYSFLCVYACINKNIFIYKIPFF